MAMSAKSRLKRNSRWDRPLSKHQRRFLAGAPFDPETLNLEERVERDGGEYGTGLIRQVRIATARREATGHGEWIDETFVKGLSAAIDDAAKGLHFGWTHGAMSEDSLGRYLGVIAGPTSYDEKTLSTYADIHLNLDSYNRKRGEHLMHRAETDASWQLSIVFKPDEKEQEVFRRAHTDGKGVFRSPDPLNTENFPHVRMSKLRGVDAVGSGAAVDELFSEDPSDALFDSLDSAVEFVVGLSDDAVDGDGFGFDEVFGIAPDRAKAFFARFMDRRGLVLVDHSRVAGNLEAEAEPAGEEMTADPAVNPQELMRRKTRLAAIDADMP